MSHLEELLAEYYEWIGCVVKCNALVGRRAKGGWEMELDVVAYDPARGRVLHLEPSLDANTWAERERRFEKKFAAGRAYILRDVFPWLPKETVLEQRAIFISVGPTRRMICNVPVVSVDETVGEIVQAVKAKGIVASAAVSEHYPLLRTI